MASRRPMVIVPPQPQQIQAGDSLGARATVTGSTANPTSANAAFVVIPEMTLTVTTIGGQLLALFDADFHIAAVADNFNYALFLDGVEIAGTRRQVSCNLAVTLGLLTVDTLAPCSAHALITLAAGSHTVDTRWAAIGGSARANDTQRKLTVIELF